MRRFGSVHRLSGRRRARGFTLLELVFAVTIVATALLGLQAAVSGAILSAGDSVNHRAARESARVKLEEILAGILAPEGGGSIEDMPNFEWTSRVEELQIGMPEAQSVTVKVVTLELSFPVESGGDGDGGGGGGGGRETIRLASVLPLERAP